MKGETKDDFYLGLHPDDVLIVKMDEPCKCGADVRHLYFNGLTVCRGCGDTQRMQMEVQK